MLRPNKEEYFGLPKTERAIIGICAICLALCSLVFFNESLSQMIFGYASEDTSRPLLGHISHFENDARHKNSSSLAWFKARQDQNIRLDDSVFTGNSSSAQVLMNGGSTVDVGANSLIVFRKVEGMNLPDFNLGNFRFKVSGSVTVAVQGKVTKIEGQGSEVQLYLGENMKPQIRILRGKVSVRENHLPEKILEANAYASIGAPLEPRKTASVEQAASPVLVPNPGEASALYTRRLYDIYEMGERGLGRRSESPSKLPYQRQLQWEVRRGNEVLKMPVHGQISRTADFSQDVLPFEAAGSSLTTKEVFIGDNYWRISLDGQKWSEPLRFQVIERDLNEPVRLYRADRGSLAMSSGTATTSLGIQPSSKMRGYVLEASSSPDFRDGATQVYWQTKEIVGLTFRKPGRYYYRVRGVNAATEVTAPSNVEEIVVEPPPPLRMAGITISRKEFHRQESTREMANAAEAKRKTSDEVLKREARKVAEKPPQKELGRHPSSVSTSSVKAEVDSAPINQGYASSKFEIESGAFTVFSPDESDVGRKNPMAMMLGLRSHHWFGQSGLEASVRVKAADGNDTAKGINPLQIEGRYLYQIHPEFLGQTQTALIGGYEMYRNIGRGYFAQKYDLVKIGASVDFPVRNRWDMGGEILYGMAADSSRKYEMAGRLNYYLRKDWSFGVGYRVYLFEAGSLKSAPLDLPYKETFGEGYSVLRWHY